MSYVNDFRVGAKPVKKVYWGDKLVWWRILSNGNLSICTNNFKDYSITRKSIETEISDKIQYNINSNNDIRNIIAIPINNNLKLKFSNSVAMPSVKELKIYSGFIKERINSYALLNFTKSARYTGTYDGFTYSNSKLRLYPQDDISSNIDFLSDINPSIRNNKALSIIINQHYTSHKNNFIHSQNAIGIYQNNNLKLNLKANIPIRGKVLGNDINAITNLNIKLDAPIRGKVKSNDIEDSINFNFKFKNWMRNPTSQIIFLTKPINNRIIINSILHTIIEQRNSTRTIIKFFSNNNIHNPTALDLLTISKTNTKNLVKMKLCGSRRFTGLMMSSFNSNAYKRNTKAIKNRSLIKVKFLNESISRLHDVIKIYQENTIKLEIKPLACIYKNYNILSKIQNNYFTINDGLMAKILPLIRNDEFILTEDVIEEEQGLVDGNTLEIRQMFQFNEYKINEKNILEVFNGE